MYKKQMNKLMAFRFKRFARKSYSIFNSLHKTVTIGVLAGCALTSAHAVSVEPVERIHAETSTDSIPPTELDEVVVTASKVGLPLNLAAKQVTIITRQEIERAPVRSIPDLLNYLAGVDILQRGPHGVQADISLRGGSFDQTAILLNGVNLTNPHTGHYSFNIPINLSDIERIEIVQGPSSLVYGASAFSGGVNIITRKDNESNGFAKLEGGMYGLFGAEARGALKTDGSMHSLSAGYKRSDGYIRNSDYDIVNLLWQNHFEIDDSKIDFQAGINNKKYGANTFYSAAYPDQFDDNRGVFASVRGETNGKLKIIPTLYWSRHYDEFQLIREGTPNLPDWYKDHNYHRSDVLGMNINMQYAWLWGITGFGGEFRNEGILSNVLGKPMRQQKGKYTVWDNRSNISFFIEHNFVFDKFTLTPGLLYSYNTALADTLQAGGFYPAVNASFRLDDAVSIYATWSKATRMPTFTDLYYKAGVHRGNADLSPEYTRSIETGIRFRYPLMTASLTGFHTRGDNLIDWVYNETDKLTHAQNLALVNTMGAGADATFFLDKWMGHQQLLRTLQIGYQYMTQTGENTAEENPISGYVFNYLRHKLTASLYHGLFKNLSLTWNFRWQDRAGSYLKYIDKDNSERKSFNPTTLLDLKAEYSTGKYSVFINANNIFNNTHVDFGNIPQPGFWLSGGASIRF